MNASQNLPEIVPIVLIRLARMRAARALPLGAFEKKLPDYVPCSCRSFETIVVFGRKG